MAKKARIRLLVHRQVQMALVKRSIIYWFSCVGFLIMPVTLWRTWNMPDQLIFGHLLAVCQEYSGILLTASALLPLAMFDMLQLSNRIAGPLFRLRGALSSLGSGENPKRIKFRENDFWQEIADEFNRVADRMHPPAAEAISEPLPQDAETSVSR